MSQRDSNTFGCVSWIMAAVMAGLLLLAVAGGGGQDQRPSTTTTSTNTTHVASDNQLNVFSVVNNGEQRIGDDASTSRTDVTGDRNVIVMDGQRLCYDASIGTYTTSACEAAK